MIATKTLFHNADRTKVVPEGHEDARFLVVREGQEIPDAIAEKLDIKGFTSASVAPVTAETKPKISHAKPSASTHKAKKK